MKQFFFLKKNLKENQHRWSCSCRSGRSGCGSLGRGWGGGGCRGIGGRVVEASGGCESLHRFIIVGYEMSE